MPKPNSNRRTICSLLFSKKHDFSKIQCQAHSEQNCKKIKKIPPTNHTFFPLLALFCIFIEVKTESI